MPKSFLYAVQDETGREICFAHVEPDRLREVVAVLNEEKDTVTIRHRGHIVASGQVPAAATELHLHRVPADDKLANPTTKRVC